MPDRSVMTIDGVPIEIASGSTILDVASDAGVEIPTLCYLASLTPANACRLCVVEVEGSRTLVPSCSRQAEDGMAVHTDTERVRHARKMVLEFLGSSADLSTAPELVELMADYGAEPERYGTGSERIRRAPIADNGLYVQDPSKCVLCYRCVEACGDDAQHTYAIGVAGRGSEAGISTEFSVALPDSACVFCGNCVAVCPTGALMVQTEHDMREAGEWDEEKQTVTRTVCTYCGVGCNLDLHVQDGSIVKVTSPRDHDVTVGNLCIKGRFGWVHVE